MLKAWDTLVGEARCLFTASVEGGDPEELCEGLVRQVSKLAVGAGGPGTTCRAAALTLGGAAALRAALRAASAARRAALASAARALRPAFAAFLAALRRRRSSPVR